MTCAAFPRASAFRADLYPPRGFNPFQERILAALADHREVWARAGNRSGKTALLAYWAVMGALNDPADALTWICTESRKVQRGGIQPYVKRFLAPHEIRRRGRKSAINSFAGAWDRVELQRVDGGRVTPAGIVEFRNYKDGAESVSASSVRRIVLDEESPEDFYRECRARTIDTNGRILGGFTAVNGLTPFLEWLERRTDVAIVAGTTYDNAAALPAGGIDAFKATFDDPDDEWEIETRIYGRALPIGGRPFFHRDALAALTARPARIERPDVAWPKFEVEVLDDAGGAEHVIGVDVAEGVGRDHGAFTVRRRGGPVVAHGEGDIDPLALHDVVVTYAARYGSPWVLPEANGPGLAFIGRALDRRALRILPRPGRLDRPDTIPSAYGFQTSGNRYDLLDRLRAAVRAGLDVGAARLIRSLQSFVWRKRPEAAQGAFDDGVMSAALAVYLDEEAPAAPRATPPPRPRADSPAEHLADLRRRKGRAA